MAEIQYLELLKEIITCGSHNRDNRTNISTISIFGARMKIDLRDGFPLFTTKYTWFEGIKKELLFFISGKTDTRILEKQGVTFWKGNTDSKALSKLNLSWNEGDMGPGYGFQWRHFGAEYFGCDRDYSGQGIDQLKNLLHDLKENPFSRRHIITAWNPVQINDMALPPCHCFVQFYVGTDDTGKAKYLDCSLYQRSGDMFLGIPFNIASYSLFMYIIGDIVGLIPRTFIHNIGDAHIYSNHLDQVKIQLERKPYPLPTLSLKEHITDIDDIDPNNFVITNYKHHPKIIANMAV